MSSLAVESEANVLLPLLFDEFWVAHKIRATSKHSERGYRNDFAGICAHLAAFVGVEPKELRVEHLSPRALRHAFGAFSDNRAAASITRAWSTWNQFFSFLVAEEIITGNPMAGVKKPKKDKRQPKPLKGEDTPEVLLRSAARGDRKARDPWPELDVTFLAVGLLTGLRVSELISLDMDSFEGRPGEKRIHTLGKGRKERSIPIEPELETLLERYVESRRRRLPLERIKQDSPFFVDRKGNRLRVGGASYLVEACLRAAGLWGSKPKGALNHALRHSFGTRLAEDGATAGEIQSLLGHEDLNTSQGYIDVIAREQREAARANRTYRVLAELLVTGLPAEHS